MNNERSAPSGPVAPESPLVRRMRGLSSIAVAVVVLSAAAFDVSAAGPVETGPRVTVTASRDATESPSETKYADTIHRALQRGSRYPTGREASLMRPSGTATVWVDVARNGKVKGHGIDRSSGSALLDQEARSLVGRTRYPAFAAGDWGDGPTHRFVVSYAFDGSTMTAGSTTTASR